MSSKGGMWSSSAVSGWELPRGTRSGLLRSLGEDPLLKGVARDILGKECYVSLGRAVGRTSLAPCLCPASAGASPGCRGGSSALQKVTEPHPWLVGLHLLLWALGGTSPGFGPWERRESACVEHGWISAPGAPRARLFQTNLVAFLHQLLNQLMWLASGRALGRDTGIAKGCGGVWM